MPKFKSYIKSLITPTKDLNIPSRWDNYLPISPKDMNDISGVVIPRVGANNWNAERDLEYLQKMYDCHDLVYSCIDLISSTFALAKLKVKRVDHKTNTHTYLPNHALQVLLDNPNNSMTGYDLKQAYIVHRLLYGTMGAILLRGNMTTSTQEANRCPMCRQFEVGDCPHILWHFNTGVVTQIMPVHLDRLEQVVVDTSIGNKTYFSYDLGDGVKRLVHPNNIMTDPNYNPGGSFYGTSPTAVVQRWLEIDLGLSRQIGAYLTNNAIPSMILNLKPPKYASGDGGSMEDPSLLLEKMKEKWMNDFSMSGNSYRNKTKTPAFVYGDLDILKVQDGIADIVQKPLFFEIQNRIGMVYKVPRSFFEFGISHRVIAADQNIDFFNYAISPQLKSFKAKIKRYILPCYNDPSLDVEWDLSSMGIASFLIDKQKAQILKQWELGLETRDGTLAALGKDTIGGDLGRSFYRIDVLGTNNNGDRLNQPNQPNQTTPSTALQPSPVDNILKPNPELTDLAGGSDDLDI